ncbi:MAG: DUF3224 domain-containing protein [bacterium]
MTQTTLARQATRVTGTFKTLGWEETPYDAAADSPKLAQANVCEELQGGIEGEASISYLVAYRDDQVASFVGLARVVGRIGERSGSFVMQDIGTFESGVAKGYWTILPASSTGEFVGIRGDGHFTSGPQEVSYTMNVSF